LAIVFYLFWPVLSRLGVDYLSVWCPPEIKRFASALDYVTATKNANVGSPFKRELEERTGLPVSESNYRALNEGRVWARLFALVFYSLGFILLSIPSINVFARVAYSLWATS
jgi:hypothetical protein